MRRPLVAGNWKMNGTRSSVAGLVQDLAAMDVPEAVQLAVFPSAVHLGQVHEGLFRSTIELGAQDCAFDAGFGALTGEVSPKQLADLGCEWVLVGHSERRLLLGESDEIVRRKFEAALSCGLKPILCVGETLEQRESGKAFEVVEAQLTAILGPLGIGVFEKAVVAYEPVWAIGTGLTASPEQAQEVHAAIRARLNKANSLVAAGTRILYGGSVKPQNAAELFAMPDIDGGLIGGASLSAEDFGAICRAVGK
ncbi:triose-phosphate isomerase [Stutzerimonas tarimensis]|uniref:Triosephosphate isomerase n=1 Tax=Stutzerimonas tarimensis TaxID=1507735 RepID=A0ABV7SZK7_9GAMM